MSRAIQAFLNGRLLVGVGVALAAAIVLAPLLARRLRIRRSAAYIAALTTMMILAITVFERAEGLPGFFPEKALTWWTTLRQPLVDVARTEAAWWLNVALFVPAGLVWGGVTRRPLAVAVALFGFSFGIETLQGLTGFGAADVTDLAANTLGGVLGATVIGIVLRVSPRMIPDVSQTIPSADEGRFASQWALGSLAATLVTFGIAFGGIHAVLAARQNALRNEAERTFEGLTIEDVNTIREADLSRLSPFLILDAGSPDSYRFYGDERPVEVRYPTDFLGFYRCVFVTFSQAPPVFVNGRGDECTEERYAE